jgi:hypothetical protein
MAVWEQQVIWGQMPQVEVVVVLVLVVKLAHMC